MDIAEVLRQNGYKVTPQRLAVYAVIRRIRMRKSFTESYNLSILP